mmetsp:Transcript_7177/g.23808  ORF Transcript_7177/g.23808 Transcript_7177/m.23808 type:complete len:277 (+) Transcript_7177:2081-2911(+)
MYHNGGITSYHRHQYTVLYKRKRSSLHSHSSLPEPRKSGVRFGIAVRVECGPVSGERRVPPPHNLPIRRVLEKDVTEQPGRARQPYRLAVRPEIVAREVHEGVAVLEPVRGPEPKGEPLLPAFRLVLEEEAFGELAPAHRSAARARLSEPRREGHNVRARKAFAVLVGDVVAAEAVVERHELVLAERAARPGGAVELEERLTVRRRGFDAFVVRCSSARLPPARTRLERAALGRLRISEPPQNVASAPVPPARVPSRLLPRRRVIEDVHLTVCEAG